MKIMENEDFVTSGHRTLVIRRNKPDERGWQRAYDAMRTTFRATGAASEKTKERARGIETIDTKVPSTLSFSYSRPKDSNKWWG